MYGIRASSKFQALLQPEPICRGKYPPHADRAQAANFWAFPVILPLPYILSADADTFDGRSDDKGAEPEGLAMAEIDGRSEPCNRPGT